MIHRVKRKHFNRDTNHRKALLRNLVRSLVETGSVTTTDTKAKELRRLSDKLIHKAQQNTISARQLLHRFFGVKDVVNTLVDRIAPAMSDRVSGFTSLTKVGNRKGDNGKMIKVALMTMPATGLGSLKQPKTAVKQEVAAKAETPKAKPAAKVTKAKVAAKKK
jgi:large subunit ribosomal protein L17